MDVPSKSKTPSKTPKSNIGNEKNIPNFKKATEFVEY